MTTAPTDKIHSDYLAPSYHTLASINYKEIIDEYSTETWIALKKELAAKGNELVFDDGIDAYFSVNCSDTAYPYIEAAWKEIIDTLDSVDPDDC